MTTWREIILKHFIPEVARLTIVSDPDGLLLETSIWQKIEERGFELVLFDDSLSFRYIYESRYRIRWNQGSGSELVLIVPGAEDMLENLPCDWLQIARKLYFSLAQLFPHLSYPIIAGLDRSLLDILFDAQERHKPTISGENATKDFILHHVYKIDLTVAPHTAELLKVLLQLHYQNQRLLPVLAERWIALLRKSENFQDWPLEKIIPDQEAFLGFIQERWPIYLKSLGMEDELAVRDVIASYSFNYTGPGLLPFGHEDIRVYIDNLFVERLLHPVEFFPSRKLSDSWISIGIQSDPRAERIDRCQKLIQNIRNSLPIEAAHYREWLKFARSWAELNNLRIAIQNEIVPSSQNDQMNIRKQFAQLRLVVDEMFCNWLLKRYSSLHNQPPSPPVMLHHVPRAIARFLNERADFKAALIVVDGLALDQWIILNELLELQCPQLQLRSDAVFAWIPTTTSVSRQALFAGKPPLYFPSSIHTTNKESDLWSQFWVDNGLAPSQFSYSRGLGELEHLVKIKEMVSDPKLRVVGLVVDKVDKIMHGMQLGSAGMYNQIKQWGEQGFLSRLLKMLTEDGFCVYLTSDHGNIEAIGIGQFSEGAAADLRGERVRIYPTIDLCKLFAQKFPDILEWEPIGLPIDYFPLLAPGRTAFIAKGENTVSHGGITIEEVIVPFIEIQKRK